MALSIIGRLFFDGKRWKAGLEQARAEAKAFGKGLPAAIGIGNIAKGLAGAFTATAAIGAAKRLIDNADRLQKAAQSVGLSSNEFSKLAFAADMSGLSVEQLTTGVSQFSRVLSEAAAGRGGQGIFEALDRLGISAEKFSSLGVVDQFKELSRALSGREINTQTLADLQALFGESGRRFVPLFQSDIAEAIRQGNQLGAFPSDASVNNLVGAKDELTKMRAAAGALATEFAALMNLQGRLQLATESFKITRGAMQGGINPSQLLQANAATISALSPVPISQQQSDAGIQILKSIQNEMQQTNEIMRRAFE